MKTLLAQAAVSGLLIGGVYALVALGLTLIFGVLRIINFAHGALMMLAMYATFFLWSLGGVDPYVGTLVVGPAFFLVGAVTPGASASRTEPAPTSSATPWSTCPASSPSWLRSVWPGPSGSSSSGPTPLVEQNVHRSLALADRAYVLEQGMVTLSGRGPELAEHEDVRRAYLGL